MTAAQQLRQEGRKEGAAKKVEEVALRLYSEKHFPIPEIADVLEVTVQEVEDILKKHGLL